MQHILRIVAQDVEIRVRQALAETLADKSNAPPDVVLALAKDDELVADPILRLSEILKPDDLVAIVQSQRNTKKMTAIAQRRNVAPSVCLAIVEHGDEKTAIEL